MDFPTVLERILVIVTVLGSLATAIATFISSRNQTKESDTSTNKVKAFMPIDAAERFSAISLSIAQNLQDQLDECNDKKDELDKLIHANSNLDIVSKVKLRKLVSRLRTVREKHDHIYGEVKNDCPGYEVLNSMLDGIITELETELEE